jgi:hypothetical protein
MPTVATASPSTSRNQDKFTWERSVHGDITVLRMTGTLNDAFEGKKLADAVKTRKVVISMEGVRRIASWGMAEWMEFLRLLGDRDLYLVECSTYATSQLNLVTGLLAHAKLVSFYAAYRCNTCNAASNSLFLIPRDRDIIRELPGSEYQCSACGGAARLEEYPAAFFDTIANREAFDVDDEVLALFRSRYRYDLSPDLTRFRALGVTTDEHAYMRLSGSFARLPAEKLAQAMRPTTVVDLEGVIFDPSNLHEWRAFVDTAVPKVKALQLMSCPPGFLETAVTTADLRGKIKIRTFALAYRCVRCDKSSAQYVDVAEYLEELVAGRLPDAKCPSCKATVMAHLDMDLLERLKVLPARDREPMLEKLVAKSRTEAAEKLTNLLTAAPRKPAAPATSRSGLYVVLGAILVLLGGVAYVAIDLWRTQREQNEQPVVAPLAIDAPAKPKFVRPEWITADTPSSAYCHDIINRLICVGVSSYRNNRDEAVTEANNAALEELVHTVGLKIGDPFFKDHVAARYGEIRNKMLGDLHAAETERTGPAYKAANDAVRSARERVVAALRASGGAAVPAQRSDWYWEEYAGEDAGPNEQLVFVRYDVNLDVVRVLLERYSKPAAAEGASFLTAFPGLAWQSADLTGGAIVTTPGRKLARAGIKAQDVVVAVGADPVTEAAQLAQKLEQADKAGEQLQLTVKSGTEPPRRVDVKL